MRRSKPKQLVERLLAEADIRIDGDRPWDPRVHNSAFFSRALSEGCLGLGEAYMDGWWDCGALDEFCCRALKVGLEKQLHSFRNCCHAVCARLFNLQSLKRAFDIGRHHYDIGNELYCRMLDRRMMYSCAYWRNATDLDQAQEAKLELVGRKLMLEPGMRVLDIGCGWGGALQYAAEKYGIEGVGITVSKAQVELARERCRGLPVEILLADYRTISGTFDRILSIGMLEHVGCKNYRTYFRKARGLLKDDGLFLLHTIGGNRSVADINCWINTYIFPNAVIPSSMQLCRASEGLFVMEDWHNFGCDYDPTLMCWFRNLNAAWSDLKSRYDERFHRMWTFYLLSCAGAFRARRQQTWQIVYSPKGVSGGCPAARSS